VFSALGGQIGQFIVRKHSEEALARKQALYRTLFELCPDGIILEDPQGNILDANQAVCELSEYSRSELLQKNVRCFVPAEAQSDVELHLARLNDGETLDHEVWNVGKHGARHLLRLRERPMALPDGQRGFLVVATDITQRKRAEQQLADALELNRALIAGSTVGIAAFKASGECVRANEALARIVGTTVEQLMSLNFRTIEVWRRHHILDHAEEVLRTRQPQQFDLQGPSTFGKQVAITAYLSSFVSQSEPHLLYMVTDITERKRAEFLLQAQRDLALSLSLTDDIRVGLEGLLDVAMQLEGVDCGGVYLLDQGIGELRLEAHRCLSPEFLWAASAYAPNSPQAQLCRAGKPVYARYAELPPESRPPETANLRGLAVIPLCYEGTVLGSLNLGSQTLEQIPAQTRAMSEALAAQASGALGRIRAEAARRRLESQLLEVADREQARIGQDLHDGLCQQLVGLAFDANALHGVLSAKHRAETGTAGRLAAELDLAITDARRLARGLFPIRLEAEGLVPALEELAQTMGGRFQLACELDCPGPVALESNAAAIHLYRIAQEALNNAIKHARPRRVLIRLRARSGALELSVEDDGCGIPARPTGQANGMGLHIMDYRARAIGGTLSVMRGAQGGTVVSCRMPRTG
jgi:PAS domain S-box-containing protein